MCNCGAKGGLAPVCFSCFVAGVDACSSSGMSESDDDGGGGDEGGFISV